MLTAILDLGFGVTEFPDDIFDWLLGISDFPDQFERIIGGLFIHILVLLISSFFFFYCLN